MGRKRPVFLGKILAATVLAFGGFACGGGSSPSSAKNPTAVVQTISPNSAALGDPAFTLSVVGSQFMPGSTVQWNGTSLPTTVVNNLLLTAQVPANAVASNGPDTVAVVNPAPGDGRANAVNFSVPCVIDPPAPATTQTKARIGFYFFDG